MERITVAEVLKMDDGLPVLKKVSGKVLVVKQPKTDSYQKTSQFIVVQDETGDIGVKIDANEKHATLVYPNDIGREISFESWQKEDKSWCGMKKASYEKDGVKNNYIHVTPTGKMTVGAVVEKLVEKKEDGNKTASSTPPIESNNSQNNNKVKIEEKTDWLAKEARELRKTIWDTCFMTIYKAETKETPLEKILDMTNRAAEIGFMFTYMKDNKDGIPTFK
jgi:hypothetical protein